MKSDSIVVLIGITAVLILLGVAPGVAEAGANQWFSIGPDGGYVSTLVVNPFNPLELYAGSGSDVFRTTDGGLSWHHRSRGLEGHDIGQVVIDPQQPHRLLAWGWTRKLFVTDNSGVEWRSVDLGSVEPSGRLYASSDDFVLFIGRVEPGAMLTSIDRGESWLKADLPDDAYLAAVHPGYPSRYLVKNENAYAITADGGASWQACGETASTNLGNAYFDPHDQNRIFIAAYNDELMVSEDGCRSWSLRSGPENSPVMSISFDPIRPDTVYSSTYEELFRSIDGGLTWAEFGPANTPVNVGAMAFPKAHQKMMYLAAVGRVEEFGVMFSADGGLMWQMRMGGFCTQRAWNLLVHPENPDYLMTGIGSRIWAGSGLYQSDDSGVSWDFVDGTEGFGPVVAMDPSMPEVLFTTSPERNIMKSSDSGVSWTEMGSTPNEVRVRAMEVDPFDSSVLFANSGSPVTAYRSDDGGGSWIHIPVVLESDEHEITSFRPDRHHANVVYAGLYAGGFARSSDGGHSWQASRQGLETNGVCDFYYCGDYWTLWDIVIDPSDPFRLFGLSSIGPFRSSDGGQTWQLVREGLMVCCELDQSWLEEGCPGYVPTKLSRPPICLGSPDAIAFDPEDPNVMYLTADGLTYRSLDGGETWLRIDDGFGSSVANEIHVVGDGVLLGASRGAGVVRFDVEEAPAPRNGGGRSGQP